MVEAFGNAPVGAPQAAAGRPLVNTQDRKRALDRALGLVAVEGLRALDASPHRLPEACALGSTDLGLPGSRKPGVELAGIEHAVAVPQCDTEHGAAAAARSHHVYHLRPDCSRGRRACGWEVHGWRSVAESPVRQGGGAVLDIVAPT